MRFEKKSRIASALALTLTILFATSAMASCASPAPPGSDKSSSDNPYDTSADMADEELKNYPNQSFYRNFQTSTASDYYEISGTLYQNEKPRGLVRFEIPSDAKLTVTGSFSPIEGELKLIYRGKDGTSVTLAEGNAEHTAETGEPVTVYSEIEASEKGEFYFESTSAICEFDLKFSTPDGISYYLTARPVPPPGNNIPSSPHETPSSCVPAVSP